MTRSQPPIDVICLVGMMYSGTTLLANLMGEHEGCVSVGELRFLPKHFRSGRFCGCGSELPDCPFWAPVVGRALRPEDDPKALAAIDSRLSLSRKLPALVRWAGESGSGARDVRRYRTLLGSLYPEIAHGAGATTVIDTSKGPAMAVLLERVPGIRLHVVHLVRDSRGTLFSHRWRGSPTFPGRTSLLLWDTWNSFAELRWGRDPRYRRVRYEDFIAAPAETLADIMAVTGRPALGSPILDAGQARLGVHHTVNGNRNRFTTGVVPLRADMRWKRELSRSDRALALALTGPLLLRYGYILDI